MYTRVELVVYLSLHEACIADSCGSISQSDVGRSERRAMSLILNCRRVDVS